MKQSIILWIAAFVITFLVGFLQSRLNNQYPVSGSFGIEGKEVGYKFDKVYYGSDSYQFLITSEIKNLEGKVFWKIENSDKWNSSDLNSNGKILIGKIPGQSPKTKIEYLVKLDYNNKEYSIPSENQAVLLTYYASVPSSVSFYYIFTLFLALLLAVRTGLEYFNLPGKMKKLNVFTLILIVVNVFAFHPLKTTYQLGAVGKGAIPISELFQISSILLLFIWIITTALIFNTKKYRIWAPLAATITIIIFELGNF